MRSLTPDELTRCARSWLNWQDEPKDVAIEMVSRGARVPAEVVAANVATITEYSCWVRANDARARRAKRIMASKRGAKSRSRMQEARHG